VWRSIESVPEGRDVWLSDGKSVTVGHIDQMGQLVWTHDCDWLLTTVTHWQDLTGAKPEPSEPGAQIIYADIYRERYARKSSPA